MTDLKDVRAEIERVIAEAMREDVPADELAERVAKATVFDDFAEELIDKAGAVD